MRPLVSYGLKLFDPRPCFTRKIELVVHCPFEAEYSAEIYAVEVNHMEEIDKLLS